MINLLLTIIDDNSNNANSKHNTKIAKPLATRPSTHLSVAETAGRLMTKVSSITTKKMTRKTSMREQVDGHFSLMAESTASLTSAPTPVLPPFGMGVAGGGRDREGREATHSQPVYTCRKHVAR